MEKTDFELKQMIAIYERRAERDHITDMKYYVESHATYVNEAGKVALREGKPINKDTFTLFRKHFTDREKVDVQNKIRSIKERYLIGMMPPELIYTDMRYEKQVYIWFVPAQKREIKFVSNERTGMPPVGQMWCPDMVFMAKGRNRLNVYALHPTDLKKRITDKTPLMNAPFMNVYTNGNVCLGSANTKAIQEAQTFTDYMMAWESLFFCSKFSHTVASNENTVRNASLEHLTVHLMKTGKRFPAGNLARAMLDKKRQLTIGHLITDKNLD